MGPHRRSAPGSATDVRRRLVSISSKVDETGEIGKPFVFTHACPTSSASPTSAVGGGCRWAYGRFRAAARLLGGVPGDLRLWPPSRAGAFASADGEAVHAHRPERGRRPRNHRRRSHRLWHALLGPGQPRSVPCGPHCAACRRLEGLQVVDPRLRRHAVLGDRRSRSDGRRQLRAQGAACTATGHLRHATDHGRTGDGWATVRRLRVHHRFCTGNLPQLSAHLHRRSSRRAQAPARLQDVESVHAAVPLAAQGVARSLRRDGRQLYAHSR